MEFKSKANAATSNAGKKNAAWTNAGKKGKRRQRPVGATAEKARKQGYKDGDVVETFGFPKMRGNCRMFLHRAGCHLESACRYRHVVGPMSSSTKVPCRDFQNGCCAWGDKCRLDHIAKGERVKSDGVCAEFNRRGKCSYGESCKYKHVRTKVDQICGQFNHWGTCEFDSCRFVHKRTKVAKPCGAFQRGECEYGDLCKFQQVVTHVKSKEICREFKFTGACSRGAGCSFRHERTMKACEPCGRHLSKDGCPYGLHCKFEHINKRKICRAYNCNGGRKCRQGSACSMAHIKLKNGRIESWERTAGFLSEQKPLVRFFSSGSSTPTTMRCSRTPTSGRSQSRAPSVMSVKTDRSASSETARLSVALSVARFNAEAASSAKAARLAAERTPEAERKAEAQRAAVQAEAQRLAREAEARRAQEAARLAEKAMRQRLAEARRIVEAERAIAKIEAQRLARKAEAQRLAREAEAQHFAQEAARLAEEAERQRLTRAIASARVRLQSAQFRSWAATDRLRQSTAELSETYKSLLAQACTAEQQAQSVENQAE